MNSKVGLGYCPLRWGENIYVAFPEDTAERVQVRMATEECVIIRCSLPTAYFTISLLVVTLLQALRVQPDPNESTGIPGSNQAQCLT